MWKNLFSVFSRNKTSFFMNIIGLSVAFMVFTVITIQVVYELSFDRSYKDLDRLYKIEFYDNLFSEYTQNLSEPYLHALAAEISGIESYCGVKEDWKRNTFKVEAENGEIKEYNENLCFVTPGFIDVFSLEVLAGDVNTYLESVDKIALPEKIAKRFFPNGNALGRTVIRENMPLTVSLIYKDLPENSTIKNVPLMLYEGEGWNNWNATAYFKLLPKVDVSQIEETIKNAHIAGMSDEMRESIKGRREMGLISMKDIYFHSKVTDNERGNINTTLAFIAIGILVIAIAYINFINFSTALAPSRIKHINTQKIMGATLAVLRRNVLLESVIISCLGFLLSLVWTKLFIATPMAAFFTANLLLTNHTLLLIILGIFAIVFGLLAGIYPAYYMTSHQPALVLKGSFALTPKGIRLRNSLLFFQFITTIVLITLAIFIKMQHSYMQNMNPGYDTESIVYVSLNREIRDKQKAFINELKSSPDITDYALSQNLPGGVGTEWGRAIDGKSVEFVVWPVSHNFLRFFNIKLVAGEDFYKHDEVGVNKVIFNQSFINKYDITDIIGKEVRCYGNNGIIVGVAEDINFNSFKYDIKPMGFVCGDDQSNNYVFLKINGIGLPQTMEYIKDLTRTFSTKEVQIGFLDERMARLYQNEKNFAKLISVFSFVTILISLMGIYGLIIFNARFKIKEIGIRKVNGATESQLVIFLNKTFFKLIGISFLFAVPVAWYFTKQWLASFPYKTPIYWWIFLFAGIMVLFITVLTVSYQSWKAATINPVNTLRNE